jgi:uncharacterized membrane protein
MKKKMDYKLNKKTIGIILLIIFLIIIISLKIFSNQSESHAVAKIISLKENSDAVFFLDDIKAIYSIKLKILTGEYKDKIINTEHYLFEDDINNLYLKLNDKVTVLLYFEDNILKAGIEEYYKSNKLLILLLFFVCVVLIITGYNGLKSIISLFLTLLLLFGFMPQLLFAGFPPILLAIVFSFVISIITIFTVYGFNYKSYSALAGTIGGVITAGFLAYYSVVVMRLSGWIGHETLYLQSIAENIDLSGLLVCGIIIGALGAVMDVTISISSAIAEIKKTSPEKDIKYLFNSGIKIGKDIIGTMTNTLVLAYAGSSFTLILLFTFQKADFPLFKIINMEYISSEIIRAVAGSMGMVIAIPLTALVSAILFCKYDS